MKPLHGPLKYWALHRIYKTSEHNNTKGRSVSSLSRRLAGRRCVFDPVIVPSFLIQEGDLSRGKGKEVEIACGSDRADPPRGRSAQHGPSEDKAALSYCYFHFYFTSLRRLRCCNQLVFVINGAASLIVNCLLHLYRAIAFARMPDQISVSEFLSETTEDYNSPTTSSFTTRLQSCRNTVSVLEEVRASIIILLTAVGKEKPGRLGQGHCGARALEKSHSRELELGQ